MKLRTGEGRSRQIMLHTDGLRDIIAAVRLKYLADCLTRGFIDSLSVRFSLVLACWVEFYLAGYGERLCESC